MEAVSGGNSSAKPGQYLTFTLEKRQFAVPIGTVREINRVGDITPVPQTAQYVSGVMNLRGKVIPVIDLRVKFGVEASPYTRETCVIVIEGRYGQVGTIVDSVSEVVDLTREQIEPPPMLARDQSTNYVMGMGKFESRVIVLVDIVEALGHDGIALAEAA